MLLIVIGKIHKAAPIKLWMLHKMLFAVSINTHTRTHNTFYNYMLTKSTASLSRYKIPSRCITYTAQQYLTKQWKPTLCFYVDFYVALRMRISNSRCDWSRTALKGLLWRHGVWEALPWSVTLCSETEATWRIKTLIVFSPLLDSCSTLVTPCLEELSSWYFHSLTAL